MFSEFLQLDECRAHSDAMIEMVFPQTKNRRFWALHAETIRRSMSLATTSNLVLRNAINVETIQSKDKQSRFLLELRVGFEEVLCQKVDSIIGSRLAHLEKSLCQRRHDMLHKVRPERGRSNLESFLLLREKNEIHENI